MSRIEYKVGNRGSWHNADGSEDVPYEALRKVMIHRTLATYTNENVQIHLDYHTFAGEPVWYPITVSVYEYEPGFTRVKKRPTEHQGFTSLDAGVEAFNLVKRKYDG